MKVQFHSFNKNRIQNLFFNTHLIFIISLAIILGLTGSIINIHFDTQKRDKNLKNVAETIAKSPILTSKNSADDNQTSVFSEYLDSLKGLLNDIDVISVVAKDGVRIYHSNHNLIGTLYDGSIPDFKNKSDGYYAVNENGPSGNQRRAYAAVYNENGEYLGFVMAIMLTRNIKKETFHMLLVFFIITCIAIFIELLAAKKISVKVKNKLLGYEPDVFTAMYKIRENILETLEEGIIAFDTNGVIQFVNNSAFCMLLGESNEALVGHSVDKIGDRVLSQTVKNGNKEININLTKSDIILDLIPIKEKNKAIGTVAILHNRAEYSKLMEDLSGTQHLVASMRANNHDFTNKLHVILGLIQMGKYDEACSYIQNVTMIQRANISKVIHTINDASIAALLIGKIARASELNVKFILREGCCYNSSDINLPTEMLITVIGNLLDNAFDAMNEDINYKSQKELLFGIYSKPRAMIITVDDTGSGISSENMERIFENGFSTKGEERGTGLYQVKAMVENHGGKIIVESQKEVGTAFTVSFSKEI